MKLKKRLLVTISFSFSIRYLYRTGMLHKLREFVEPVIAITWNEEALIEEMKSEGFEVHIIPVSTKDRAYADVRTKIDYWFDAFALKYTAKKVQRKYLSQYTPFKVRVKRKLRERFNTAKMLVPGFKDKLFQSEQQMLGRHTNYNDMLQLVDQLNIDAVFTVTPFQTQEDILLRACKARSKKMITSILSFDNITKRGWIPVPYDHYMVWNNYNYEEVQSIYPASATKANTTIVGAPQFDFYFRQEFLVPKDDWKIKTNLPVDDRKVILYAGGPQRLFPNEPQYLQHIMQAISSGEIKGNPIVLFRCHPIDNVERWQNYVGNHSNLFYDISWTGKDNIYSVDITIDDIKKLCSTLAHTDVHINLCSTMTLDGCAYNKPQIGPAYDDVNSSAAHLLRGLYNQKHFQPIVKTNGLRLATSKSDLIKNINEALLHPENFTKECKAILNEIITYTDNNSTDRVVKVIKDVLA